eukprot:gene17813-biopygen5373
MSNSRVRGAAKAACFARVQDCSAVGKRGLRIAGRWGSPGSGLLFGGESRVQDCSAVGNPGFRIAVRLGIPGSGLLVEAAPHTPCGRCVVPNWRVPPAPSSSAPAQEPRGPEGRAAAAPRPGEPSPAILGRPGSGIPKTAALIHILFPDPPTPPPQTPGIW